MDDAIYRRNAMQMIELCRCAVHKETPQASLISEIDPDTLFQVCESHTLTACTAYALEAAGVKHSAFREEKEKAVRKEVLFDAERAGLLRQLSAQKIWHMPLKGVWIKKLYPRIGMRQMSDNDILFDAEYREQVRKIMEDNGYTCEHFGTGHNDEYSKQPVYHFEMHPMLFSSFNANGMFYEYFRDTKKRLKADEKDPYLFHFTKEDFYIYLVAHEYKHYQDGGTGVRSLLDVYLYLEKNKDMLDWDYLNREMKQLRLADYEAQNRELAVHLFSGETLTESEQEQLEYYISSGTYGTVKNSIENKMRKGGGSKLRYIMRRIFPGMEWLRVYAPFFYRHKWLIPAFCVIRPVQALIRKRDRVRSEIRNLKEIGK